MPDPIRHVIVLMLENHSFDHLLGSFKAVYPNINAIDPANPAANKDLDGNTYWQQSTTNVSGVDPDPPHELNNTLTQISQNNSRFVSTYQAAHSGTTIPQRERIMEYYALDSLMALHALAREFRICDRWHSSVPGPTWTNRFFVHSGTSLGWTSMPSGVFNPHLHWYNQDTIYDRLNASNIKWRIYYGDIPQSLLLVNQRWPANAARYRPLERFFSKCAEPEQDFPAFAFIEPKYFLPNQNDDHPPHKVLNAQRLIADVYNAVRSNIALWESSLIVVAYDEHGGFYDHVIPPPAVPPDHHHREYTFDQYGVRVPSVLISPWLDAEVDSRLLDHTSILRYLIDKWSLARLTNRSDRANSILPPTAMLAAPRENTPAHIDVPDPFSTMTLMETDTALPLHLNDHQKALLLFTEQLERETRDTADAKVSRSVLMLEGVRNQVSVGTERVERFLHQQRETVGG